MKNWSQHPVMQVVSMPGEFSIHLILPIILVSSLLLNLQLIQRILIVFMPQKYQPDYKFLRHVPLIKVHLYTGIQITSLAALWAVKSISSISIVFPLMVGKFILWFRLNNNLHYTCKQMQVWKLKKKHSKEKNKQTKNQKKKNKKK